MTDHKKTFTRPKFFVPLLVVGLLVASQADKPYLQAALQAILRAVAAPVSPVFPQVDCSQTPDAFKPFCQALPTLTSQQRADLQVFYAGLAKALRADPQAEPVFTSTTSVRSAHRAGLLFVWRGFLDAAPNPSLQSGIEGVLDSILGREQVPLNPSLRSQAADGFDLMARLCASR